MAWNIHISGIVQGVGFRPFIYRLAQEFGLKGWVYNATDGVHIHIEGDQKTLDAFIGAISLRHPPAALICAIETVKVPTQSCTSQEPTQSCSTDGFRILPSRALEQTRTLISADLACCAECQRELFDSDNRRFRYPFINCTNCGPRFTIIEALPYDRAHTSMSDFALCAPCATEYHDPSDRRFHAQPDACFDCGPQLDFWQPARDEHLVAHNRTESDLIIAKTVDLLVSGAVVALKGLGGYHLACDAANATAVTSLRRRKLRGRKPLALMVADLKQARRYCKVTDAEARLLASPQTPIVLLQPLPQTVACAFSIAAQAGAGVSELGLMLPSTPLQHLICAAGGRPLVMTSANISSEPIIADDSQAQWRLAEVADAFVGNNRRIVSAYDDSVLRVLSCSMTPQFIRRARGYAPAPIPLPTSLPDGHALLALGSEQKSCFCLSAGNEAFVSQHLGDLENADSFHNYKRTLHHYQKLLSIQPGQLVCDLHPDYLSTQLARQWAQDEGLPLLEVQHHHAHIAAVLGENNAECAIGLAFDGTGFGPDRTVWGGEVLLATQTSYRRLARLAHLPLVGQAAAIKHPARLAYALLYESELTEHPGATGLKGGLARADRLVLRQMLDGQVNTQRASSMGRLFDAISALCGLCATASYDGEPAMLLEAAASRTVPAAGERGATLSSYNAYHFDIIPSIDEHKAACKHVASPKADDLAATTAEVNRPVPVLDFHALLKAVLDDLADGIPVSHIARRFHDALLAACVDICHLARLETGLDVVALSGGVFMNRYLAERLPPLLTSQNFTVLTHHQLPPNDGCLAYGQTVVAAARFQAGCS
ncbi:MAG: carbamoyltransferase HypF [Coriobacteriales bacterium]|jgi:hydrogenase maturation protein HypF|nr:carbamoyltransferase HypF [Coriobacteriales bacterium]